MKRNEKNQKGVTLIGLVITIIILIILASVATYSGISVINSSKLTAFTAELKIMQTEVNELYEKNKSGEDVSIYGTDITTASVEVQTQAEKVFKILGITDYSGYKFFDSSTIKNTLKIEGVKQEVFVNIDKRSVVSYKGLKYEGQMYYTLEQLNKIYNVEYQAPSTEGPTFEASYENIENNKSRITISNIQYQGNIAKWEVKYKLDGWDYWAESEDLSFFVTESGLYTIQLINGNIKSDEKIITIENSNSIPTLLPAEYQQVDYIESTGTQYIDTMVKANSLDSIEVTCMSTGKGSIASQQMIFGGRSDENSLQQVMCCFDIGGTWSYFSWGEREQIKAIIPELNIKYSINILNNELYINDTIYMTYTNSFLGDTNIYLFNLNGDTQVRPFYGRIYSFKIKDKINLIPCYSTTTVTDVNGKECPKDTVGLYDTVNNVFYTNQGTGVFEKGNDVEYETEKLLIFCESTVESTTDDNVKTWKDMSGNNNDITLNNVKINEDKSLSAIDATTSAEKDINISGNHTIEVVAKYDTTDIGYVYALQQDAEHYLYLWNYSDSGTTFSYRYRASQKWDVFDNITDETAIQGKMYSISIAFNETQKVAKIYINGVYKKSVTLSYYTTMENKKILLLNSTTSDRPLTGGSIYAFRMYKQELTEEQIKNNFDIDNEKYGIE